MAKGEDEVRERIGRIPGDEGWWKSGSMDAYMQAATKLQELGMFDDDIVELLSSNCFGG